MAKEVNNTIGKMTMVIKMQAIEKIRTDDKTPIRWLADMDLPAIDLKPIYKK